MKIKEFGSKEEGVPSAPFDMPLIFWNDEKNSPL